LCAGSAPGARILPSFCASRRKWWWWRRSDLSVCAGPDFRETTRPPPAGLAFCRTSGRDGGLSKNGGGWR
jgi:hypothetical protein